MTNEYWIAKCNELQEFQQACVRKAQTEEQALYFGQTVQLIRKLRELLIREMLLVTDSGDVIRTRIDTDEEVEDEERG